MVTGLANYIIEKERAGTYLGPSSDFHWQTWSSNGIVMVMVIVIVDERKNGMIGIKRWEMDEWITYPWDILRDTKNLQRLQEHRFFSNERVSDLLPVYPTIDGQYIYIYIYIYINI